MVVNPNGPTPIFDGGVPSTITARCAVGVTGGQLVYFSGLSNAFSSGADSYATNEVHVAGAASGALFNGIVVTPGNTASGTNNFVAVARNGTWLLTSAGTILGGHAIFANGADAVIGGNDTITGSYTPIGRSISAAGSEGYTAVSFFG